MTTKKNKKKRCPYHGCNRKLKLTDFPCHCQKIYCSKHRLPEQHSCFHNFRNETDEEFMKRVGLGGGEYKKVNNI